jgi:tRNA-2-methylthio-N6-dimethylallyladenosine synthase
MNYYIQTLGCQMNKNDSERIATVVERLGYEQVSSQDDADLIVVNTCSVRQSAEDRVYGQARNWERLKEKNPKLVVAVTGCMPGRDRDGMLRKKLPVVDLFFPIRDVVKLPRWLSEVNPEIVNTGDLEEDYLRVQPKHTGAKQAYVTIMSGCNNYCTFCVVPYARGFERSKPVREVLREVGKLHERGYLEVTLLGQNVNTYRPEDRESFSKENPFMDSFAALLWEVNRFSGIQRVHFTAPNPQDMSSEVIEALSLPHQVNFLHLPVQAGANRILKKMNRRYTRERYCEIIEAVRNVRPTVAIATDIIVGFCTETEKEFMETVELYKQVRFDISYTAMYSSRSGTVAGKAWDDDVPRAEKKRRWEYLQSVMTEITYEKNQEYVGKIVSVLAESFEGGIVSGRSSEFKLVRFPGAEDLVGTIVPVRVSRAYEWLLVGEKT